MSVLDEAVAWLASRGSALWQEGIDRADVAWRIERADVWLAAEGGTPVGTLQLQWSDPTFWGERPDDAGYVHRVAIRRSHAGLGAALLRWAEQRIIAEGCRFARLDCDRDIAELHRYYRAAGYHWCADRTDLPFPTSLYEKPL